MYAKTKNLLATCTAEACGTGFLGGLCAYPVAKLLMGIEPAGAFVYVIPFLISTAAGSILAFVLLGILEKSGVLKMMQSKLI
jgi:energy coupling factor transporter S component ThiW